MPWSRPTLTQLRERAIQDIAAAQIRDGVTGGVVNPLLLQFDPLTILAKVLAGLAYEEYGYQDYIALQATPATATDEQALGWGGTIGVTLKPATSAAGVCSYPNVSGADVDVPSGTLLIRADGTLYQTTADVVVSAGGSGSLPYAALEPGVAGSLAVGASLALSSPIAGMGPVGTVTRVAAPGTDIETIDQLKVRYLLQYANPPQGGAASDYVEWALAVAGVTRAWVNPLGAGAGTVVIYFMLDQAEYAHAGFPVGTDGVSQHEARAVPATGDQLLLADAIYPLRPATALIYACAPIAYPVPFVLRPKSPVPASVTAAVNAAIAATFNAIGNPLGEVLEISPFETAIAAVPGMPDFTILSPALPIQAPLGSLPIWAGVSYA